MAVFRKGEGFIPTTTPLYSVPRPLTAAAASIRIDDKKEMEQFRDRRSAYANKWQGEAWEYYDAIGEIKYAFNLVASVVSRVRLYTAVIDDPAEAPVPIRNSSTVDPQLSAAAERARLTKDLATVQKDQQTAQVKLGNEGFMAKAPVEVVAEIKERLVKTQAEIERITAALAALPSA